MLQCDQELTELNRQTHATAVRHPKVGRGSRTAYFYIPVSKSMAHRKARALLSAFGTQRSKDSFSEETFLGLMRLREMECRAAGGNAEAFHAHKTDSRRASDV